MLQVVLVVSSFNQKMKDKVFLVYLTFVSVAKSDKTVQNCSANEFESIRNNYEQCANNKILTITSQIKSGSEEVEHQKIICSAVRQLIDNCGTLLVKCFTRDQIDETKNKQKSGIKTILRRHFTEDQIVQCFSDQKNITDHNHINEVVTETDIDSVTPALTTSVAPDDESEETIDQVEVVAPTHQKDDTTLDITTNKTTHSKATITEKIKILPTVKSSPTSKLNTSRLVTTVTASTSASTVKSSPETTNLLIGNDQATTPSSAFPLKCSETEYKETREKYEICASNKIREITTWLERRERRRRSGNINGDDTKDNTEERESIMTVCDAVRQLLYDCGNELGWCFTEDQVSETRFKQKDGLEDILSKYYSAETLKMCFIQDSVTDFSAEDSHDRDNAIETEKVPNENNETSQIENRRPKFFPSMKKSSGQRTYSNSLIISVYFVVITLSYF